MNSHKIEFVALIYSALTGNAATGLPAAEILDLNHSTYAPVLHSFSLALAMHSYQVPLNDHLWL
jgi:hypothetical protein